MHSIRKVYRWSKGAISFDLPQGWSDDSEDECISFSSPSKDTALTITIHTDPALTASDVARLEAERMPFGRAKSKKRPVRMSEGSGYIQDFIKKKEDTEIFFMVFFIFLKEVTVIASINGPEKIVEQSRSSVEGIMSSFRIQTE